MEISKEILEQAKTANSAEELVILAKENGMEVTQQEASAYFKQLHASGEIEDEELENVAGGGCGQAQVQKQTYRLFPDKGHIMWRGNKYCYEKNQNRGCMSTYWLVKSQDSESGWVEWECPLCGYSWGAHITHLMEVY